MDNSQNYFCVYCGSLLNAQGGFSPDYASWKCTDCKQVLQGTQLHNKVDRFNGIVWTCESCGSILNRQPNFDPSYYSWPCLKCHHTNILIQDESIESPKETQAEKEYSSAPSTLYCPTCNRPLSISDLQTYQGYCPYCKNKLFSYQEPQTPSRIVYPYNPVVQPNQYAQPVPKYNKYYYDSSRKYAPYGVPVNELKNQPQPLASYPPPVVLPPVGAPPPQPTYMATPPPKTVTYVKYSHPKRKDNNSSKKHLSIILGAFGILFILFGLMSNNLPNFSFSAGCMLLFILALVWLIPSKKRR